MYFEIYRDPPATGLLGAHMSGEWRWRLRGANNEIIASGEGYKNKEDCLHAIALVQSSTTSTPIRGA